MENHSIGQLIGRTARLLGNKLTGNFHEADLDLTKEQWILLRLLEEGEGMNQQDIAEYCMKDKTSITRQLEVMERKNLIVRVTDQSDKRNKRVHITEQARKLKTSAEKVVQKTLDEVIKNIPGKDVEVTKSVLKQVCENINKK